MVIFSAVTPDLIPNQARIDPFCLEPKPVGVNQVMPRSAYQGQTPNEMFFGTGNFFEAELKQARETARQSRIDVNRKRTCAACVISEPEMHTIQLDKP